MVRPRIPGVSPSARQPVVRGQLIPQGPRTSLWNGGQQNGAESGKVASDSVRRSASDGQAEGARQKEVAGRESGKVADGSAEWSAIGGQAEEAWQSRAAARKAVKAGRESAQEPVTVARTAAQQDGSAVGKVEGLAQDLVGGLVTSAQDAAATTRQLAAGQPAVPGLSVVSARPANSAAQQADTARRARALPQRRAVKLTRARPRHALVHMTHASAMGWLKREGLKTTSSGHCTNKYMHNCTSLDSVRTSTVARLVELKRESRCPIMITGGTESGHAAGRYSHGEGYKIDITHGSCIDRYITKNYPRSGVRSDGSTLYGSNSGTVFADESDHWDILFR